ncbi:MAG: hypothetical protein NUV31_07725 [Dehalococcoidales bacterium]|jgi:hypothetical protein|nr:hypothetical protein [Dehalococcoidales bacterium]
MDNIDYNRYLVKYPATGHLRTYYNGNCTSPPLVYMSSQLIPEVRYYIEFSWIWGIPYPEPPANLAFFSRFNQVFLFIGGDCFNPEELGAEIDLRIESQILRINSTGALFIPGGTRYGPLFWRTWGKPHALLKILLGDGQDEGISPATWKDEAGDSKSSQLPETNYEKYLVRKPAYEVVAGTPVKNRQGPSSMTLMSNNLIPGSNIYIEGGWVWGMPDPNPHIFEHSHDYEEIVLHFGTDYGNPEELGGEIEFHVEGQPLLVNQTSAIYIPAGKKHGPLIWKKYHSPHLEMAIMPGAGTLAEADPGGHQKKIKKEGY